ncbi:siderophore-interacting protein [Paraoerskovia sediminicola]|uniref:siderophore-interacting protein n=1 Tax=Paraoerskovia sediminicola TaxID=1138587 RepID=UPI0025729797|nr:siderophore-interacting protein [Paraoerskovia sediminicola]
MVRLVLGGPDLEALDPGPYTDRYVKLLFPEHGDAERPPMRTYTIRAWDVARSQMAVDFVVHGDQGIAGPWAARAEVGDRVLVRGPGGGYAPDPAADWHLLIGDETALPAIAAAAEAVAPGTPVVALVEVGSAGDEIPFTSPGHLDLRWVRRDERPAEPTGDALVAAVDALDLDALRSEHGGDPQVFLHGEAGSVRIVRRALRAAGVGPASLSASGYWRLGRDDEAWRAEKRDWAAGVEQDEAKVLAGA